MSGKLRIHFAPGTPPSVVEVVSPDLDTIGRVWLGPGHSTEIDVPSEGSFLRVHLQSGRVVTLRDPGNLDRTVDRSSLEGVPESAPADALFEAESADAAEAPGGDAAAQHPSPFLVGLSRVGRRSPERLLADRIEVELRDAGGSARKGLVDGRKLRAEYTSLVESGSYDLRVATPSTQLDVRLPGRLQSVTVAVTEAGDRAARVLVRVRSTNPTADALGAYLTRGDMYSAGSMSNWAQSAENMFQSKAQDPWAATVGAYLLLKLRSFDQMHSWARNLADGWPEIADGSIIWAWQLIHQKGDVSEIRRYLKKAASQGLPVFCEGLRLLGEGLRLLPEEAETVKRLNSETGRVLWESPFTARVWTNARDAEDDLRFDVGYAAPA